MGLFRKNEKNIEKTNIKCDVCGKTVMDIINHNDKHVCNECYLEIFNENKDKK